MSPRKPDGCPDGFDPLSEAGLGVPVDSAAWRREVADEARRGGRMLGWFLAGLLLLCVCGLIGSCVVAVWRAVP